MPIDYNGLILGFLLTAFFGWRLVSAHRTGQISLRSGQVKRTSGFLTDFSFAYALLAALFGVGVLLIAFSFHLPKAPSFALAGVGVAAAMAPLLRWYHPRN